MPGKLLHVVRPDAARCRRLAGFFGGAARHAIVYTLQEARKGARSHTRANVRTGEHAAVSNARAAWRAALWGERRQLAAEIVDTIMPDGARRRHTAWVTR